MNQPTTTAEQSAADELNVLFPDQRLEIGGKSIEVREYTLLQQMQYRDKFEPFIQSLRALLSSNEELTFDAVQACIAKHYDDVFTLIGIATGESQSFIQNLKGEDADALLAAWWVVNSDFFVKRVVLPLQEKILKNAHQSALSNLVKSSIG